MTKEFYARTGDSNKGKAPQTYRDHLEGVYRRCEEDLNQILKYAYFKDETRRENFRQSLLQAARFHDLGKLEPENQRILSGNKRSSALPYHHEDAGILYLRDTAPFSAALIAAHHRGLMDKSAENERGSWKFRVYKTSDSTEEIEKAHHIEAHYRGYLTNHFNIFGESEIYSDLDDSKKGIDYRLALACLADADYGDAAAYFQDDLSEDNSHPTRWPERLEALDRYVEELAAVSACNERQNQERNRDRADLYRECREKETDQDSVIMETCSSPVGTGKTTAVMARLLRIAAERNLRHIFVVLPFTNIIEQSVETYRKALVLPGEDAEEIVAAHHHLVDYKTAEDRERTRLWKAPIIVTTAVQFFETLASNRPSRLRKLQELPGSAVFIDEVHAALPLAYWPVTLRWIKRLTSRWGCHFILGSGSLQKYWENPFLMNSQRFSENRSPRPSKTQKNGISAENFQEILSPDLQERLETREGKRVRFRPENFAWDFKDLINRLQEDQGGSKLVVLNTVFSAASVADRLRELGVDVLHLSTALTPADRKRILQKVRNRLNPSHSEYCADWILVATSCVEAGVDFSFQKGYRESSTLTSLLQTAGRVNRHFEKEDAEVVSFRFLQDENLTLHPGFKFQQRILAELFEEGYFRRSLAEILKEELNRLVNSSREILEEKAELLGDEDGNQFKTMSEKYRLISNPSKLVVVDDDLADRMGRGEKILFREIQEKSIQIWEDKIEKLNLPPIPNYEGIYRWQGYYDPDFLGYMTAETREKLKG